MILTLSLCLEIHITLWLVFYATETFLSSVYGYITLLRLYCIMSGWSAARTVLCWVIVFMDSLSFCIVSLNFSKAMVTVSHNTLMASSGNMDWMREEQGCLRTG